MRSPAICGKRCGNIARWSVDADDVLAAICLRAPPRARAAFDGCAAPCRRYTLSSCAISSLPSIVSGSLAGAEPLRVVGQPLQAPHDAHAETCRDEQREQDADEPRRRGSSPPEQLDVREWSASEAGRGSSPRSA